MSDDSYEELPDSCWVSWTWGAYWGLEWWQWMPARYRPLEVQ